MQLNEFVPWCPAQTGITHADATTPTAIVFMHLTAHANLVEQMHHDTHSMSRNTPTLYHPDYRTAPDVDIYVR